MNKFCVSVLTLFFSVTCVFGAYFNDDIPKGAGAYGALYSNSSLSNTNLNHYSRIDNTYFSPSGTSYNVQDNQIYGSDGSNYTQFGSTIQNNSTGKMYQINGNLIEELR